MQGTSLYDELSPGVEGATIAAEILDASESLRDLCAKCGQNLTAETALVTCCGVCLPRRTFHARCLPQSKRTDPTFKCLICDPSTKEDFCFCCNGPPTADIIMCRRNTTTGCTNFVHTTCYTAKAQSVFLCGLC